MGNRKKCRVLQFNPFSDRRRHYRNSFNIPTCFIQGQIDAQESENWLYDPNPTHSEYTLLWCFIDSAHSYW